MAHLNFKVTFPDGTSVCVMRGSVVLVTIQSERPSLDVLTFVRERERDSGDLDWAWKPPIRDREGSPPLGRGTAEQADDGHALPEHPVPEPDLEAED